MLVAAGERPQRIRSSSLAASRTSFFLFPFSFFLSPFSFPFPLFLSFSLSFVEPPKAPRACPCGRWRCCSRTALRRHAALCAGAEGRTWDYLPRRLRSPPPSKNSPHRVAFALLPLSANQAARLRVCAFAQRQRRSVTAAPLMATRLCSCTRPKAPGARSRAQRGATPLPRRLLLLESLSHSWVKMMEGRKRQKTPEV